MEITIYIDDNFVPYVDPEPIKKALLTTLHFFGEDIMSTPERGISLTITDDNSIRRLNRQYRGLDKPTDVLSFENKPDPDFPDPDLTLRGHIGDIIIAYPVAKAQARAAGHTPLEEIILLTVHGVLHLLGFDHDTPPHKEAMWAAQNQVMAKLDLSYIQPTEG